MRCFTYLVSVLFLSFASAEPSCTKIDLSHKIVEPKYRGKRAYCYALAISQVLSSELKIKPPDTVSAFDLIALYVTANKQDIARAKAKKRALYGKPGDQLGFLSDYALANKTGEPMYKRQAGYGELLGGMIANRGYVCLESQVPSQALYVDGRDDRSWHYMEDRIGYLTNQYMDAPTALPESGPRVYGQPRACKESFIKTQIERGKQIHGAVNDWAAAQMTMSNERACTKRIPTGQLDVTVQAFNGLDDDPQLGAKAIDAQLESGHIFDLSYDRCLTRLCHPKENEAHEVPVIGRYPDPKTGECRLVLQDVFGSRCRELPADVTCKRGVYTIPYKKITRSRFGVIAIHKK